MEKIGKNSTRGARGLHIEEWRGTERESEGTDAKGVLTGTEHNRLSKRRKTTSVLDLLPQS